MENDRNQQDDASLLRRRAEERLKSKEMEMPHPRTEAEIQRFLHELQVHQIELEMQNAELRRARDELETALERYTDLYDFAPVGYVTLDREGVIREVNLAGALLLGEDRSRLLGRRFALHVSGESSHTFAAFLRKIFEVEEKGSLEVALTNEGDQPLFVQIEAVSYESGQKCRFAVIDITVRKLAEDARKHMEDELHRLNEELEARVRERTAELEAKHVELRQTIRLFARRELSMFELEKKLALLEKKEQRA